MSINTNDNLIVSSSPHLVDDITTSKIMTYVLIALFPALVVSGIVFGPRAIILTLVCAVSSVLFEYLFNKITKRSQTISDRSAIVTGVLLAFNIPSNFPYWMAIIGCFVAIVIVKCLFGGIGQNFANPALVARIVLFISFATNMTSWPVPGERIFLASDAKTAATPLGLLQHGDFDNMPSNMSLFLGTIGGSMGEVSALALLIGGLFLIWKKVISPITPVCFIAVVAIFALLAGQDPVFHVCAGGVMIGAFFMATDYATTPITNLGKAIFGIGCGFLTMSIRLFGSYPEGVSFAIVIMNMCTPLIDMACQKKLYGGAEKNEK